MPTIQQLVRKGRESKSDEDEDAGPQGRAPASRRVHPRLHDHAQEAELGAAQGRPRAAHERHRGHRLHPRRGPQPAGALDRARARRPGEGPAGCPLQDHPRHPRHLRRARPQAGRSRYGAKREAEPMPRKGPAPRRELMPDPIYRSVLVTQIVNKVLVARQALAGRAHRLRRARDHQGQDRRRAHRHPQAGASRTSSPSSRSRAAGSAAPPTRCRSRCGPAGPTRSPSAGSSATPASGGRRRWPSAWPTSSSTPPTASARR